MNEQTIYVVVTEQAYANFWAIECAFTTRADAEEYIAQHEMHRGFGGELTTDARIHEVTLYSDVATATDD